MKTVEENVWRLQHTQGVEVRGGLRWKTDAGERPRIQE